MENLESEKLESRTYQEVIAASAIKSNTLVVLPTGLGKTVIAAIVASEKVAEGKVLFTAPTKPLVEQHRKTFQNLLKLEVEEMEVLTGKTRPDDRTEKWREKRVIFATPQIVENDLISGKVPVEDFSLVIFDEAHRATGSYSYVFISEKFRAHKLALTASPGGSKEKIMEVAENLEISNFELRTEDDPDVKPYVEDKEVKWEKVSLDESFSKTVNLMKSAKRDQLKELKSMGFIDNTSGITKKDLLDKRGEISSKISTSDDPENYRAMSRVAAALKVSQAVELLETQGVTQCHRYLMEMKQDDSKAATKILQNENMEKARNLVEHLRKKGVEHPKIGKLEEIISSRENIKAMVFTEYRESARVIIEKLEESGIEASLFIGQQGDRGMSQTEQKEILEEFREDNFDVLVSTSIGEEGLDIPSVDMVIFYEPVASGIRDIQRSGRTGREDSGEVHVLMAEDTRDEGSYWSAHHRKKRMKKVLQDLREEELDTQETLDSFENEKRDLKIVADDRENSIAKKLSRKNIEVEKKRIDVSDFLVSENVAVERKTAPDLVDSIIDNRIFDQLGDLQKYDKPILIVEGKELYSHREISPDAVRGALSSVAVDYGVPIIWTEDEDETTEMLETLAEREQEDRRDVSVRAEKTPKKTEELQRYIVSGLPDINDKIAGRLLERLGTVEEVFSADKDELKEVKGVGEKTAEKLRDIIAEDYSGR